MQHSPQTPEVLSPVASLRGPNTQQSVLALLPRIGDAESTEIVATLFRDAVLCMGADAGVFMSHLQDDATRNSLRSLWSCDPVWTAEYASRSYFTHDPWLQYARDASEPTLASTLHPRCSEQQDFQAAAALHGFASALIAPAPSGVGASRVGMLCLGSQKVGHFERLGDATVRVLARALAMELHRWLQQSLRQELLRRSQITAAELELLRHEAAGRSSKAIAAALQVEPTAIDCRFQRLNAKLHATDRRTALRIARLYGLL